MFAAELAGKVAATKPPHERMEDVLTSNVFSSFRYLDNSELLTQFLCRARNAEGKSLVIADIADFEITFWPKFRFVGTGYREPDVLITAQSFSGRKIAIVVEAKLDSGLSNVVESNEEKNEENNKEGFSLGHQLADQFCGLDCGAWLSQEIANTMAEADEKYLLFLTAHHSLPKTDLQDTASEVATRQGAGKCKPDRWDVPSRLYWLNWQALHQLLEEWEPRAETAVSKGTNHLLTDLKGSLEHKNLRSMQAWKTELVKVGEYRGQFVQQLVAPAAGWFQMEKLKQVKCYQGNYRTELL